MAVLALLTTQAKAIVAGGCEEMKTKEQRIVLGDRSLDPLQIAFVRALTDIECSLLDKVEAVANQKEAAELLTADLWRDLLTQVEIGRRSRLMREARMIIQEKPLV
jgi:hypothetical protein